MPKPPKDPGYFDKVNYVIEAWDRPCDAPAWFYVEALKPAALKAFITLISFGWDDVMRGWIRPRNLGLRRTGKRKGKFRRAVPRFPELGEMLGGYLPDADEIKGREWSQAGKALWLIDGGIQHVLFWWLVVDVTIDFAYDFSSVLYESKWCRQAHLGRFSFQTSGLNIFPGNIWIPLTFDVEDYHYPPPNWHGNFGIAGAKGATVTAGVNYAPATIGVPATEFSTRIVDLTTGKVLDQTEAAPVTPLGDAQNLANAAVSPINAFQVQGRHNGSFGWYYDGIVGAMEDDA